MFKLIEEYFNKKYTTYEILSTIHSSAGDIKGAIQFLASCDPIKPISSLMMAN
jgi:hypothetical protein